MYCSDSHAKRLRLLTTTAAGLFGLLLACEPAHSAELPGQQLAELIDQMWEFSLQEDPLLATSVGDLRFNDRLSSVSVADSKRRNTANEQFLEQLDGIDRQLLSRSERTNFDILRRQLSDSLAEHEFGTYLIPINQRSGFHIDLPEIRRKVPLNTTTDYENYIARLRAFSEHTDGHIELMRAGIAAGQVLPAIVMEGYEPTIETHLVDDPRRSLYYEPLDELPAAIPESEHDRLRDAAAEAIATAIVPAYRRFGEFLKNEYLPQARGSIGASALPEGREFYRHRVRRFTTLEMTPDEVHQLGLAEVKRIRGEMDQIIRQVEFDGDFAAFTESLRTDPKFYAETADELLKEVSLVLKKMDGKLPTLFGRLPRMSYGLRPVPDYIAPRTTAAYYMRPSGDGTRAGFYYMNTYNLKSRPLYMIEALSLHEAVPGHHLQIALQQEIEDLPNFRKYSGFTAFVEGWALYSERLGLEAGFYEDPYSDFGRLTMEIWRACRLVVDTGIHYFGWTRERAIDYLHANSAMSLHNIRSEVDRYISWPGQALAYKLGELKIRQLRQLAEERLGSRFDLRAFHDMVLAGGSVPLNILEQNVEIWIETQTERTASAAL